MVNLEDGSPYTSFIPWFDMRAMEQARFIEANIDQLEVFSKTGLRASYKHGLPKLLWLLHKKGELPCNVKWLSAADYIAFKLTGAVTTDYTLAARTFAYDLKNNAWNVELLNRMGIRVDIFPEVVKSGTAIGFLKDEMRAKLNITGDIPVCICGHDHLCAAFGAGVVSPGSVLDSMGTAETLVGIMPGRQLGEVQGVSTIFEAVLCWTGFSVFRVIARYYLELQGWILEITAFMYMLYIWRGLYEKNMCSR
ncbi:FGGY family carbohydrate kinase [Caldicoprobacter faecalis]|uniref:Xylulokinase n=1 Tax=Caldicoprobacter faecalis TaxID=937334 RepID=A0A1I5VH48_9FIRM|nr:FGGY family carbohydrate kinase [Caldicoprobacter faecalis]SFQ06306.1 xylulokinase [Caldicoprobacter faecalis]